MSTINFSEVRDKIEDLQAVFRLGQQTMPFLEELFHFIEDIEPLLNEINASIRESTHKMPHAKSKLKSVTEATKLATTEILDLVEGTLHEVKMLTSTLERTAESLDAIQTTDEQLLELLRQELPDHRHDLIQLIESIHNKKQALLQECVGGSDDMLNAVQSIRQQLTQMMMALQVQDITSQQISAVNHMIESLRSRMTRLVEHPSMNLHGPDVPPLESEGSFDLDAQYDSTGDHQRCADDLIDYLQQQDGRIESPSQDADSEIATQEDIDQIFG